MSEEPLSFAARVWLAWACFFRILFDAGFARAVRQAQSPALPEATPTPTPTPSPSPSSPSPTPSPAPPAPSPSPALSLLALLQREARFIDFVQQDLASFSDDQIGAAARVVHEGCQKAIRGHVDLEPVHEAAEGDRVSVEEGYDPSAVKLTGDVRGKAPYRGVLRHRGWRAANVSLPEPMAGHDARILAPAEVEL